MDQSFRDMCLQFAKMHVRWYFENRREGVPKTAGWNRRRALYWLAQAKRAAA